MINKEQITAIWLGLFAVGGPLASWLVKYTGMDGRTVEAIMSLAQILTPMAAGGIYLYLQRDAAKVKGIESLPTDKKVEALQSAPDDVKVKVAEAVPDVATVVLKDTVNGKLGDLAQSDAYPNIVTESQNALDKEKGR